MTYVVAGTAKVAGKTLGETLSDDDLADANIPALVKGGHIKPAGTTTTKAAKADNEEKG